MMKYRFLLLLIMALFQFSTGLSQIKVEREHRIKKNQFPEAAHDFIKVKLQNAKKLRFYKETDTSKISYEAKFKKDKLYYSIEFDESGKLEVIEILIKEVDVPEDSWSKITKFLNEKFNKFKIRKIQQQYPIASDQNVETTLNNAFQNLLIPSLNYELLVRGKIHDEHADYEILFGAEGDFIKMRESLPANYDHVLY
ncbi:hypothetical protein [uncultured Eudoraea sp.]|uniref:hypothetical protein n=1 Tax=uncultured Eudoraea sp. TaxID=1035614 RepID=UPI0026202573|nr:hypothetical protein [uncultured Eudoraea sp.]